MSRVQKQTSDFEKEVLALKKLRQAKSFLKSNDALDEWLDRQIRTRETQIYQEKRGEARPVYIFVSDWEKMSDDRKQKYMGQN